MTTTERHGPQPPSNRAGHPGRYWFVAGLFCFIFIYSAGWTFVDPVGTRAEGVARGRGRPHVAPAGQLRTARDA